MTRHALALAVACAAGAAAADPAAADPAPASAAKPIDMGEGAPIDAPVTTPPPDQQHPSLLPCRYSGCDTHDEQLDDPFEQRPERVPIAPPRWQLALFAGAGAAYHAGGSRISPEAAIDGRVHAGGIPHVGPGAVDLRLDWSQRGGDDGRFDAFGASAAYDLVVFAPRAAWLSVLAGVRGELRTDAMLGATSVERAGVGYTAAIELAIRRVPLAIAARYDEDLTELAPGIRERAVFIEIGGALRSGLRY